MNVLLEADVERASMKVFILARNYEDGDGSLHSGFLGVFATKALAIAAALEHWRKTRLKELGHCHSGQRSVQEAIEQSRVEFNEQVTTGNPPPEEFSIEEHEVVGSP